MQNDIKLLELHFAVVTRAVNEVLNYGVWGFFVHYLVERISKDQRGT